MCWALQCVLGAFTVVPITCTLFGEWYAIEEGDKCVTTAACTLYYWKNSTSCTMKTHYSKHMCDKYNDDWVSIWGPPDFCQKRRKAINITSVASVLTAVSLLMGILQCHTFSRLKLYISMVTTFFGMILEVIACVIVASTKPNGHFGWRGAFWASVFSIPIMFASLVFFGFLLVVSKSKTYAILLELSAPMNRAEEADGESSPRRRK
mmetsp:Transcript_70586/g.169117  ORF Transcript_70586/g.169117 Transcript_70586/m.169117 type:complete len:207 (+) Transcript_70586:65-685(+)